MISQTNISLENHLLHLPDVEVFQKMEFALETDRDVAIQILLQLDNRSLFSLCQTSKSVNEICRDDTFWSRKIAQDYGLSVLRAKPTNEGPRF